MKTLLHKEFAWNWRSFRFPALILIFLFFALLDPLTIRYMSEIMSQLVEDFPMDFPDPTAWEAYFSYLNSISQIGFLVMIFMIMGSVAKEKENGVAAWILSKPVGRWNYLLAKVINIYALLILGIAFSSTVAYLYTWSLMERLDAGAFWATAGVVVFGIFIASLTFCLSTIMKTPLRAGGLSVLIFLLSGIANIFISETSLAKFYPNTLLGELSLLLQGKSEAEEIAVTMAVTFGLSLLLVFLAGKRFNKMEL